jgi:hypothetical protein
MNFALFHPFLPFFVLPISFALRAERRNTKRVKRGEKSKIHPISRTAHQKWRGVRFKMGGANLHFEVRLRGKIIISKIKKKIPENQREKLILRNFFFKQITYSCTNPIIWSVFHPA